ncbi:MAG: thiolase domain-containing protein [Chloroflexota bacterium]|nr:thiolase domain-containing protein [Chloroflexota bacterium]
MRPVAIVAGGISRFDLPRYELAEELVAEAFRELLDDVPDLKVKDIQNHIASYFSDHFEQQAAMHWIINDYIGLSSKPVVRVENGGATPMTAVITGWWSVASGAYDLCLVTGWEKMSEVHTAKVSELIACASDADFEFPVGGFYSGYYATMATRHMYLYGDTEEDLARIAVKNRNNSLENPYAQWRRQYGKKLTVEDVLHSRLVAWPYKLLDCSLVSDGAAALLLASEEWAQRLTDKPVWIAGVGMGSDTMRPGDRIDNPAWPGLYPEAEKRYPAIPSRPRAAYPEMTNLASVRVAAQKAYRMAGIRNPSQELDLCEIQDPFDGVELAMYEDLLLCEQGEGKRLVREGKTEVGGAIPVNVSGGSEGQGHPVGATLIAQTVHALWQLRGDIEKKFGSSKMQVPHAQTALIQSHGGVGAVGTVCILRR